MMLDKSKRRQTTLLLTTLSGSFREIVQKAIELQENTFSSAFVRDVSK
jgi:hypothetical protein